MVYLIYNQLKGDVVNMKKLIIGLMVAVGILGGCSQQAQETVTIEDLRASSTGSKWAVDKQEVVESNVGNGEEYAYTITAVIDDEVYGIPLNKESSTNKGIFLYKSEIGFDVGEGDNIVVVWGEEEDIFESIEKAIVAEDGSIVPESYYY
jgi:uncharacterized lipoprotein NlpE involved in copper resistance